MFTDDATIQQIPGFKGFPTFVVVDRAGKVRLAITETDDNYPGTPARRRRGPPRRTRAARRTGQEAGGGAQEETILTLRECFRSALSRSLAPARERSVPESPFAPRRDSVSAPMSPFAPRRDSVSAPMSPFAPRRDSPYTLRRASYTTQRPSSRSTARPGHPNSRDLRRRNSPAPSNAPPAVRRR